jgi:hypothetical protein
MAASHHPPSEYRPAAPAEENSSLTTAGSRACRDCPKVSLELRNRIFDRTPRAVTLTDEGRRFQLPLLTRLEEAATDVANSAASPRGRLRANADRKAHAGGA